MWIIPQLEEYKDVKYFMRFNHYCMVKSIKWNDIPKKWEIGLFLTILSTILFNFRKENEMATVQLSKNGSTYSKCFLLSAEDLTSEEAEKTLAGVNKILFGFEASTEVKKNAFETIVPDFGNVTNAHLRALLVTAWLSYKLEGNKINTIKLIRLLSSYNLKEAKDLVDYAVGHSGYLNFDPVNGEHGDGRY